MSASIVIGKWVLSVILCASFFECAVLCWGTSCWQFKACCLFLLLLYLSFFGLSFWECAVLCGARCAVHICLCLCRFLFLRAVLPHLSHLFCRRRGGGPTQLALRWTATILWHYHWKNLCRFVKILSLANLASCVIGFGLAGKCGNTANIPEIAIYITKLLTLDILAGFI